MRKVLLYNKYGSRWPAAPPPPVPLARDLDGISQECLKDGDGGNPLNVARDALVEARSLVGELQRETKFDDWFAERYLASKPPGFGGEVLSPTRKNGVNMMGD